MFYVGVAVAVAIGVSLGMGIYHNREQILSRIEKPFQSIMGWLLTIGKWILIIAITGLVIYGIYRLIKRIDWDSVGIILIRIALIAGYIWLMGWLYRITHKEKK